MNFADGIFGDRAPHPLDNLPEAPAGEVHVYMIAAPGAWIGWRDLRQSQPDDIFPDMSGARLGAYREWRQEVDRLVYQGRKVAEERLGYDGSLARGPFMSVLPFAGQSIPLVGWEAGPSRVAFIASPVSLPYLDHLRDHAEAVRAAPPKAQGFTDFLLD